MARVTDLVQLLVDLEGRALIEVTHVSSVAAVANPFACASLEGGGIRLHHSKENVTRGVSCCAVSSN
jgi:hypothetical protein